MLVAVLMMFVVFSFTGVAVPNVAYLSTSTPAETVNNIKLQYAIESEILLDLSEDTHFERALASDKAINTNGYETDMDKENRSRFFTFLPEVDLDYFTDNAVAIHPESFHKFEGGKGKGKGKQSDDDEMADGIHIFTGSFIEFKNMNLANHTLVLKKGQVSGPIVGNTISLEPGEDYQNHIQFKDSETSPPLPLTQRFQG